MSVVKVLAGLFVLFLFPCTVRSADLASPLCTDALDGRPKNFSEWLELPLGAETSPLHHTNKNLPVLVIGAGPAGLAVMRALKEQGIPFRAVERHSEVGGLWNRDNPYSVAYDSVVTNASKATMSLGFPFPKEWPPYLSHQHANIYLGEYAKKFGLIPNIDFQTEVTRLEPTGQGTWRAQKRNGQGYSSTEEYRAVIAASGFHNRVNRRLPDKIWDRIEEKYRIHSSDYKNPERYRGKRVLVWGVGNSGAEIAGEVSKVAARTVIAVRSTPWVAPLWVGLKNWRYLRIPADVFAKGHLFPHSVEMWLFRQLQWLLVGHPEHDLGFPPLDHDILDKLPISDRGLVEGIKQKRITIRSNVRSVKDRRVAFEDPNQASEEFDEFIFATGYHRRYPFLPEAFRDLDREDLELGFHLFHPTEPGLVYMPEMVVPQGAWPIFWQQAQTIAAYFAAESQGLPNVADYNRRRGLPNPDFKGPIFRLADDFHADAEKYENALREFREWILKGALKP